MKQPTRLFVIECVPGTNLASRWEKTLTSRSPLYTYWLPNPESPAHPNGTSMEAVLKKLAQPHVDTIQHPHDLTPEHRRQLRNVMYNSKRQQQPVHVVGVIDAHSPFGSWRQTESLLRFMHESQVPAFVHLGSWHPTPSEIRLHVRELAQWQSPYVTFASLFPMNPSDHLCDDTFFGYIQRHPLAELQDTSFPLQRAHRYDDVVLTDETPVIVVNELIAPRHAHHSTEPRFTRLRHHEATAPRMGRMLDNKQHVMVLTSKPHYEHAFAGSDVQHPYYERVLHHSPAELLEVYVSPHFGYHTEPHNTYALLHDEPKKPIDGLVSHALKRNDEPFACCFVQKDKLHKNLVVTNTELDDSRSLYHELAERF